MNQLYVEQLYSLTDTICKTLFLAKLGLLKRQNPEKELNYMAVNSSNTQTAALPSIISPLYVLC